MQTTNQNSEYAASRAYKAAMMYLLDDLNENGILKVMEKTLSLMEDPRYKKVSK